MLEDGLSYPLNGDNALGRIIIGTVLSFASVLILPVFVLLGYFVRVLRHSALDDPDPPAFDEWGDMLVDGLKAFVVTLVYGIVPFALMAVSIGFGVLGPASGNNTAAGITGGIGLIGVLVSLLALVVLYYLIPAALTNMALEDSVGAAFDFETLKPVLLSSDYLVAWLLPFVIGLVANVVTFVLVAVTFGLGALVVPFIQFYVQLSIFYMFGRAFGKVTGVATDGTSPTPTESPA